MKKAMISQPMRNKTEEEITTTRKRAVERLVNLGYEVVDTYFSDEWLNKQDEKEIANLSLYFLAKSLKEMAKCDAVYFCRDWEQARGCRLEEQAALEYGVETIYE